MHLLVLLLSIITLVKSSSESQSSIEDTTKAKRGIAYVRDNGAFGGAYKPTLLYADTAPSASAAVYSNPKALYSIQQSTQIRPVLVPEAASKPFVYDQYPPHSQHEQSQVNSGETSQSQLVFNHQFPSQQHLNQFVNNPANLQPQPNQYHGAQTVVNPIQHSSYIHHTPYTIPGGSPQSRYYLVNGKMYYQNTQPQNHVRANPVHGQQQQYQRTHYPQKAPVVQQQHQYQNLNNVAPVQFGHHQTHSYQKPEPQRQDKEEQEEEEEEDKGEQREAEEGEDDEGVEEKEDIKEDSEDAEEAEEEEERPASYKTNEEQEQEKEEEEEEEEGPFSKYHALEEPDHERFEEEAAEEDDDSDGGSSYHVPKNKKSQKYQNKPSRYEFYDSFNFKPSIKRIVKTKPVKNVRNFSPKSDNKYVNSKSSSKEKQKKTDNNSKQSQNVPIAVHKFYKEKWYLAKEANIK